MSREDGKIDRDDLPKCRVCEEQGGKDLAVYLAFIGIRMGTREWQSWELVCELHRHDYAAFLLVKQVPEVKAKPSRVQYCKVLLNKRTGPKCLLRKGHRSPHSFPG